MKKITLTKLIELNKYLKSFAFIIKEKIYYSDNLSPFKISDFLNIDIKEISSKLKIIDSTKTFDLNKDLDKDLIQELFLELGFEEFENIDELDFFEKLQRYFLKNIKTKINKRPLIVTIMGHVDHGKTTLLDTIRKSSLTKKEVGAITQKLGAYKVIHNNENIIFIDTPGHEFFNSMRQRGTEVTDLVILVVSGIEGVKPQTKESIELAQKAKIPILVFVNKNDLPGFDLKNIQTQLSEYGLISSEWGGKTIFISGSAKTNQGVDLLLDVIIEQEKKIKPIAQDSKFARAIILDSYIEQSGPLVSIIVKSGKLKLKDSIIVSNIYGRIKIMKDDKGKNIKEAVAGDCVLVNGLLSSPLVGSILYNFESDQMVKTLSNFIDQKIKNQKKQILKPSLDDLFKIDNRNKINIILKIDTKGSEEAILQAIEKLLKIKRKNELKFIVLNIGELTINDVKFAQKTNAFILTFNTKIKSSVMRELKEKSVDYFQYQLIYELLEQLEKFAEGKHIKQLVVDVVGKMKITNLFKHSKLGTIAGGIVTEGNISRSQKLLRVIRNEEIIIDKQKILTIRHEKDEIDVVATKQTCGILFKTPFDFKINDVIEQYVIVFKKNDK